MTMNRPLHGAAANLICLTIDVEWAAPEVLADLVNLVNERKVRATFFCTHGGIEVPGHERALHPNFRRHGDTLRQLRQRVGPVLDSWTDTEIYRYVIRTTQTFCPEAVGVRAHSLLYDPDVLPVYHQVGLKYDSSYFLPITPYLTPVWKEFEILEIPIYYMDHFDLIQQATDFRLEGLHLNQPGLKVFDFHPNIIFINASTTVHYLDSKPFYHDYKQLLKRRHPGRGVRTLFLELLDFLATQQIPTATLADLNTAWRTPQG